MQTNFAQAVTEARIGKGLSVNAVAERADISTSTLQSYLKDDGASDPTLAKAEKVCAAVGLEFYIGPPRYSYGSQPVPTPVPPAPGMGTWPTNWLYRLAEFFGTLPDECPFTQPGRECPLLAAAKRARQLT